MSSLRYIEADGETLETSFQALEVVSVVVVGQRYDNKKPKLTISFWKNFKFMVEKGTSEGYGQLLNLLEKRYQFGLGYQPSLGKEEVLAPVLTRDISVDSRDLLYSGIQSK